MRSQKRSMSQFVFGIGSLLVLVLLFSATWARAQEGNGEDASTQPPPRNSDRTAPVRRAVVLERVPLEGDAVQVLVELPAVADAYISSSKPDENFANDALFVGYSSEFGAERSLLRFDVEGEIPSGVAIQSAEMQLQLSYASPTNDDPMPIIVRDLTTSWQESTVTWNSEPVWGNIHDTENVGTTMSSYTWDVTTLVKEWANGTRDNYGLQIAGDEGQAQPSERAFYSRETTTGHQPRLRVTYETDVPDVSVDPLPEFSPATFTVSWTNYGTNVDHYEIQYRVDAGEWIDWLTDVAPDVTSAEFTGEDGRTYEFRARGVGESGNTEPFGEPEASTTVDATPPVTVVNALPPLTNQMSFTVSWTVENEEEEPDVAYYDVQYRLNRGAWVPWQQQTLTNTVTFTAMRDGLFEFEARAVDKLGNVEPFHDQPEANIVVDAEAPFIQPRLWMPIINKP